MQELESINSVFKDRLFKIPDYQRGYAWTTKQLGDFWEDLVNLPLDKMHYTGVLSLKRVDEDVWKNWNDDIWLIKDRGYKPCHVVDGQQRLTTFVIFIQAIVDLVSKFHEDDRDEIYLGTTSLSDIVSTYLVIAKPPQKIINTYKFGYEEDNPSFKYLRHKILGEEHGGTVAETFYTLNLENAKHFFDENLQNIYEKYGIDEIEVLFRKATQNMMFNVYDIGDNFDVYVAFETMNNRGKKLSNLELLKNRLIYLTTLYDQSELKEDERNALRNKINNAWKEIYWQVGRNKKKPLNDDDFLVAHWIMYFQYSRQKGDDYIRFLLDEKFTPKHVFEKVEITTKSVVEVEEALPEEPDIEDVENGNGVETIDEQKIQPKLTPKEIENYVNNLQSAAVHWYNIHNPVGNKELTKGESLWLDRINRIGALYFRPLLTVSFIAPKVTSADREKLFKAIERYIFITFRLGRALSTYGNSEFYRVAKQLNNGKISINEIIELLENRMYWSYISDDDDEASEYFDYEHFQKYLQKKFQNGGGFYQWNGLRYFLYEYEMEKVRGRGSEKIDWSLFVKHEKDKVSIEHVYPQTPTNKCWKNSFKGTSKKERSILNGSLGNLLPLSLSINSSLQNDCFKDKKNPKFNDNGDKTRQGYSDGSHSEIEVSLYESWTPIEIKERGIKMLEFMERRWNLKFEEKDHMISLLFLDFMKDDE